MLLVKTKIGQSKIHGIGVFADEFIPKGTVIWKFTPGFDQKFTREQILNFPELIQIYIVKYSWKGVKSKLYCFCSDNAKYFNHSDDPNTLSAYTNDEEEVMTTAIRDIQPYEELTDNYSSFEADEDNDNVLKEIQEKFNLVDEADPWVKVEMVGDESNHS